MTFPAPNEAPDFPTVFDVETNVEPHLKRLLEENLVVPGSEALTILQTRDATEQTTPRLDLQFQLGGAYPADKPSRIPLAVPGGLEAFMNAWSYTLFIDVITLRVRDGETVDPTIHSRLRAQLRYFLQYNAAVFHSEALPYHVLTQVIDNGTQYLPRELADADVSRLSFRGVVGVRTDSWPVAR